MHPAAIHLAPTTLSGDCPVSESAAARLVCLPLHAGISDAQLERVVNAAVGWQPA
jgi:dTDP-4-amino-4,6-dideoxygalactose transaminase